MGMRDHIAHGYFDIDADVVFQTIKNSKFMCLSRHERNWRKTLPSRMNTAFVCRISDMKLIENQSKCRPNFLNTCKKQQAPKRGYEETIFYMTIFRVAIRRYGEYALGKKVAERQIGIYMEGME